MSRCAKINSYTKYKIYLIERFVCCMDIQMLLVIFELFSGVQNGTSQTPTSGMFLHSTMLSSLLNCLLLQLSVHSTLYEKQS